MADPPTGQGPPSKFLAASTVADLNEGKIVASDVGATIVGVEREDLLAFSYELVWAVAKGQLQVDKAAVAVKAIGLGEDITAISDMLPETLWMVWVELDPEKAAEHRSRLVELVHQLVNRDTLVNKVKLKEVLEPDFMAELGYVQSVQVSKNKEVKLNTKMNYTQVKYNLLREESEGYAKLVTLLNQYGDAAIKEETYEATAKEMKSLIGFFDLDPTRVFDIILDAFQQQPKTVIFARFIHNFSPRVVAQNLGFKFQQAHKEGKGTPKHLSCVAAALLKEGLVSLEALMGHLEPSDDDLKALQLNAEESLQKAIGQIGIVNLATKSNAEDKDKTIKDMGISAERLDLNNRRFLETATSGLSATSQQLALLEGCLLVGTWEVSRKLAEHLQHCGLNPADHQPVAKALTKLISKQLGPMAQSLYPSGVSGPSVLDEEVPYTAPPSFTEELLDMLQLLGVHTSTDQRLWSQLCRTVRMQIRFYQHQISLGSIQNGSAVQGLELAESLFLRNLLPAMTLIPTTPATAHEVWAILSLYSYPQRYRFYAEWRGMTDRMPVLAAASKLAGAEVKKVLRRLHVTGGQQSRKEGMRPFARLVSKIACTGPFSTLSALLSQVESYSNLVDPVLEAMRNLTPLAFDLLTFLIIDKLVSSGRQKLKEDGVNTADWLKALSAFTAGACRKFSNHIGLHILCQYVVNQLKDQKSYDLLVISDIIKTMSGIESVSDISDTQVEACAGGPVLRTEVVFFALQKNSKHIHRSMQALLQALQQGESTQQLTLPLLILICQLRDAIEILPDAKDIKFISEQYDTCQQSFLQLLEFLRVALTHEQYAAMLPEPQVIMQDFFLDATTALTLHRPLLSHIQPPAVAANDEEDGEIDAPKDTDMDASAAGQKEDASVVASAEQHVWTQQLQMVRGLYKEEMWQILSPELVLTFWSLSYGDIYFPAARYKQEEEQMGMTIKSKEHAIRDAKFNEEMARRQTEAQSRYGNTEEVVIPPDSIDIPAAQKEISRLQDALKKLPVEAKRQASHVETTERKLKRVRDIMKMTAVVSSRSPREMLQSCVIPRLLMSPEDAIFCAYFFLRMHDLDMPGFPTCYAINEAFGLLMPYLYIATDLEALHIGIFINAIMQIYQRWLTDEKVYAAECVGKYGFREKWTDPKAISFEQFHEITKKWHDRVHSACLSSLRSSNYVRIKNTLHVLSRIIKVFPMEENHAVALRNAAAEIVKAGKSGKERREDILNRANNYHAIVSAELKRKSRFAKLDTPKASLPAEKATAAAGAADKPRTGKDKEIVLTVAGTAALKSEPAAAKQPKDGRPLKESAAQPVATSTTAVDRGIKQSVVIEEARKDSLAPEGKNRAVSLPSSKRPRETDKAKAPGETAAASTPAKRTRTSHDSAAQPTKAAAAIENSKAAPNATANPGSGNVEQKAKRAQAETAKPEGTGGPSRETGARETNVAVGKQKVSHDKIVKGSHEAGSRRGASKHGTGSAVTRGSEKATDQGQGSAGSHSRQRAGKEVLTTSNAKLSRAKRKSSEPKAEPAHPSKTRPSASGPSTDQSLAASNLAAEKNAREMALLAFQQQSLSNPARSLDKPTGQPAKAEGAKPVKIGTEQTKGGPSTKQAKAEIEVGRTDGKDAVPDKAQHPAPHAEILPAEANGGGHLGEAEGQKVKEGQALQPAAKASATEGDRGKEAMPAGIDVPEKPAAKRQLEARSMFTQAIQGLGTRQTKRARAKQNLDADQAGASMKLDGKTEKLSSLGPSAGSNGSLAGFAQPSQGLEKNGGQDKPTDKEPQLVSEGPADKRKDKKQKKEKKDKKAKKSKRHRGEDPDSEEKDARKGLSPSPSIRSSDSRSKKRKRK